MPGKDRRGVDEVRSHHVSGFVLNGVGFKSETQTTGQSERTDSKAVLLIELFRRGPMNDPVHKCKCQPMSTSSTCLYILNFATFYSNL